MHFSFFTPLYRQLMQNCLVEIPSEINGFPPGIFVFSDWPGCVCSFDQRCANQIHSFSLQAKIFNMTILNIQTYICFHHIVQRLVGWKGLQGVYFLEVQLEVDPDWQEPGNCAKEKPKHSQKVWRGLICVEAEMGYSTHGLRLLYRCIL